MSKPFIEQCVDLINQGNQDQLNGKQWASVLTSYLPFSQFCDWDKLNGADWSMLLREQPQYADHCQWDKLDQWCWSYLLQQPQFENHPMYKLNVL